MCIFCLCLGFVEGITLMMTALQDGKTPLHLASEHGHVHVVEMLIGAQANINLLDKVLYM